MADLCTVIELSTYFCNSRDHEYCHAIDLYPLEHQKLTVIGRGSYHMANGLWAIPLKNIYIVKCCGRQMQRMCVSTGHQAQQFCASNTYL